MSNTARVIGSAEVIRKLQKVRAASLSVLSDGQIASLLEARVRARFDAGEDPNNRAWVGLAESTIARKRKGGFPKPEQPLYRTGLLRKSIGIVQGSSEGLFAGATGAGFRIGVRDPRAAEYGRLQNYGYGEVPARRFMGISALDSRAVQEAIRRKMKSISNGI